MSSVVVVDRECEAAWIIDGFITRMKTYPGYSSQDNSLMQQVFCNRITPEVKAIAMIYSDTVAYSLFGIHEMHELIVAHEAAMFADSFVSL